MPGRFRPKASFLPAPPQQDFPAQTPFMPLALFLIVARFSGL
ncbi:hypothetical protein [Pontibacter sp. H249]